MESSIISRSAWGAHPPKDRFTFDGPAPFVIIHHSYKPDVALSPSCCRKSMLEIQNLHQKERGWSDIGYTFAICGDGNVYEGRGFNVVAAHAPLYNNRSIGLLLIGDFTGKQLVDDGDNSCCQWFSALLYEMK
ncbi:unnamed protein product [Ceratitis capitata]|uniref:(Mediterranean fruit fly) hypothetical protein n=1 Tax=Ceratitis capitata TaxID=7213 RepID=A0A811UGG8_CERCA|nr:unnamed protein product [Ceratitis capitata]